MVRPLGVIFLGKHFCADLCETRRANTCLPVERVFPKATTICLCSEVNGRLQTTQWGACSTWCSSLRAGHMIGVSHTDFDYCLECMPSTTRPFSLRDVLDGHESGIACGYKCTQTKCMPPPMPLPLLLLPHPGDGDRHGGHKVAIAHPQKLIPICDVSHLQLEDAAHRSLAWCLCSRLKPQDPTPRVARQMQMLKTQASRSNTTSSQTNANNVL